METVATGDVHSHSRRRAVLQDALVAIGHRATLDGSERERRGNRECVLRPPAEMADRFPEDPAAVARTAELAARLEFDLTQELGYRYPDFADGEETADAAAAPRLRARVRRALRRRERPQAASPRAPGGGAAADRLPRALRLLPPPLRGARAGARDRARPARPERGPKRPAAGQGPRLLGGLDRLLPHRALARRSRRRRPLARPLPQPGARLRPRHRPRLPARRPRAADRGGDRALRARARGARGDLLDVSRPRRHPRRRQGARPAFRGAGAARARHERRPAPRGGGAGGAARLEDEARVAPLASARLALQGDRRAAAPPLPASGRDGDLLAPARRARARGAGGDGGTAALPVGQGLVRRRRLPEDRPARARDALRHRGLRRADRARARRDGRPLAHPARRPGRLRGDPGGRHRRHVPDREPRADAEPAAHAPREHGRPHRPGGARPPGADPGRRRPPVHRPAREAARGSLVSHRVRPSAAGGGARGDVRRRRLPGPGAGGGDGAGRVLDRRGGGAAPRDEPQALAGGAGGVSRAVRRGGGGERRRRGDGEPRLRQARRLLRASASRSRMPPPSRCSRTSRRGCAATTRWSSSARCSTPSRWASTRRPASSATRSGAA